MFVKFSEFAPHALFCKFAPHALKGQKLLAQGNALGINSSQQGACKGKSFRIWVIKLFPLQGVYL